MINTLLSKVNSLLRPHYKISFFNSNLNQRANSVLVLIFDFKGSVEESFVHQVQHYRRPIFSNLWLQIKEQLSPILIYYTQYYVVCKKLFKKIIRDNSVSVFRKEFLILLKIRLEINIELKLLRIGLT